MSFHVQLELSVSYYIYVRSNVPLREQDFVSVSFIFVFTLGEILKVVTEAILMLGIGLILEGHSALLIIHLKIISLCKEIAPLRTEAFFSFSEC